MTERKRSLFKICEVACGRQVGRRSKTRGYITREREMKERKQKNDEASYGIAIRSTKNYTVTVLLNSLGQGPQFHIFPTRPPGGYSDYAKAIGWLWKLKAPCMPLRSHMLANTYTYVIITSIITSIFILSYVD